MPGLLPIIVGVLVTAGFILIFASGQYRRPRLWRAIGSVLLSIPAAALTYLFLGIRLARAHNLSRFYSWPFGGEHIGKDGPLVASSLVFVGMWFILLFGASNLLSKPSNADRRR